MTQRRSKFNSINDSIKFTIETPKKGEIILNFLDIAIKVSDQDIAYLWFTKKEHSNISLHNDSGVPRHVKTNLNNSITQVVKRCLIHETKNLPPWKNSAADSVSMSTATWTFKGS